MDIDKILTRQRSVWVFGYGSLTWKPGFSYLRKEIGYIKGYKRRFWQGNKTHRGTNDRIGRVATLVPSKKSHVWGVAYEISGEESIRKALGGLCMREVTLGGYIITMVPFYPRDKHTKPLMTLLYIATKDNDLFLGDCRLETMALEITQAKGDAGSNVEYVTKLADYIRKHIPEDTDTHLFELDQRLRTLSLQSEELNDDTIGQSKLHESDKDCLNAEDEVDDCDKSLLKHDKSIDAIASYLYMCHSINGFGRL